jgi:hypothetical protein
VQRHTLPILDLALAMQPDDGPAPRRSGSHTGDVRHVFARLDRAPVSSAGLLRSATARKFAHRPAAANAMLRSHREALVPDVILPP